MDFGELKKRYESAKKNYSLPSFKELNENFEIDRIERDTDLILREVRKAMIEKVISYIRLCEMVLNPSQAPPLFMHFVKGMKPEELKAVSQIYEDFARLEIDSLHLEINYSEENEAKAISKILGEWNKKKPELISMIEAMKRSAFSTPDRKEKNYFG